MACSKKGIRLSSSWIIFNDQLSNFIALSKHLIANLSQILNLIIINRDKDHPILF